MGCRRTVCACVSMCERVGSVKRECQFTQNGENFILSKPCMFEHATRPKSSSYGHFGPVVTRQSSSAVSVAVSKREGSEHLNNNNTFSTRESSCIPALHTTTTKCLSHNHAWRICANRVNAERSILCTLEVTRCSEDELARDLANEEFYEFECKTIERHSKMKVTHSQHRPFLSSALRVRALSHKV